MPLPWDPSQTNTVTAREAASAVPTNTPTAGVSKAQREGVSRRELWKEAKEKEGTLYGQLAQAGAASWAQRVPFSASRSSHCLGAGRMAEPVAAPRPAVLVREGEGGRI